MKNICKLLSISMILGMLLISVKADANWLKTENTNTNSSQEAEQNSEIQKQDSLPEGVTQDWLNSLRDENGNKIIPEEPETDAMLPKIFNAPSATSSFGVSVSDAGDVNGDGYSDIIIGADNYSSATGRAYIYYGGVNMNTIADVTLTGEAANNQFGFPASRAGDVNGDGYSDVIVAAYGYSSSKGRVYIYFGGSLMNNIADVIITGEAANNYFGISASSAGDVNGDSYSDVIVGAYGNSSNTGKAYIYFGGSSMNNIADVTMTGEAVNNYYGVSVSDAGDVNGDSFSDVIVGAFINSSSTGRAYIYFGGSSMNNIADVTMTGGATNNYFGYSVSAAGDVNGDGYSDVIVGAYGYSSNTGRAYIFHGGSSMNNGADVTITGEATNNNFGWSVSSAGDINGDGYSDVVVGAWGYLINIGRAYIYFGGSSMNNTADVTVTGEGTSNSFGYTVSTCGDVNGDGYSEVIVGAYGNSSNNGRAYLYDYYPNGEITYDINMTGGAAGNYFGGSVSTAGDVNGDGYSDVIVGAYGYSSNTGRAYIYFGGSSMNNVADVTMTGEAIDNSFGYTVSSAGDVNGDGYSDVIVGAAGYSLSIGRAYIYFGGSSMNNGADVTMTGATAGIYFGNSVSSAGDVNGDGYADVIVGALGYSLSIGRAYVYFGGSSMNNFADVTMTGETTGNSFGISVSSAGDMNGDGYSDVVVGAGGYLSATGRSYLYIAPSLTPNIKINLVMFIQGFYNPVSNSQVSDSITAYLRNNNPPYNIADQFKAIVSTNGISSLKFADAPTGTYFLVLKHRNGIETWSANGIILRRTLTPTDYDFSITSSQAYGSNQKQVDALPVRFAMYGGDINQDGIIDAGDISAVEQDALNSVTGYLPTDVTGDGAVDASDVSLVENNAVNSVSVITP